MNTTNIIWTKKSQIESKWYSGKTNSGQSTGLRSYELFGQLRASGLTMKSARNRQGHVQLVRRVVEASLVGGLEFCVHALGVAGVGVAVVEREAVAQPLTRLGFSSSRTRSSKSIIISVIARPLLLRANSVR